MLSKSSTAQKLTVSKISVAAVKATKQIQGWGWGSAGRCNWWACWSFWFSTFKFEGECVDFKRREKKGER
jgi:hypothetical protein